MLPTTCTGDPTRTADPIIGHTYNISSSGLKVRLEDSDRLKMGDRVFLQLETPQIDGFINLQGEIRWIDRSADEAGMTIGLQLVGLDLDVWDKWMDLLSWHTD